VSFRALAVFLVVMNVAVAAYAWWRPQPVSKAPDAALPNTPALVLLSERSDADMQSIAAQTQVGTDANNDSGLPANNPVTVATLPAASVAQACQRLGPFENRADAQSKMRAVTGLTVAGQIIESQETEARGYWVYLPSSKDGADARDVALAKARQLSAAGVRDYYVVTAGERENTISLGMFRDAINADKRVAQVAALGFYPKREERGDKLTRYWIRFAADAQLQAEIKEQLTRQLRVEASSCAQVSG
jgi:hypothetical protein